MVGDGGSLGLNFRLSRYPQSTVVAIYLSRSDRQTRANQILLLPMSFSKRLSMAWDGSAPYEDTDTLVLTGRTYFVDVRVKKGSDPPSLDWAFAGTRTSTPGEKPGRLVEWNILIQGITF